MTFAANHKTGGMKSRNASAEMLGKGRSQPPQKSVTAIADTVIMLAYSARKNRENLKPLYSVWNPATSSDSASGKSNGARFVSATPQIKKRMKPTGWRKTYQKPAFFWDSTIFTRLKLPASIRTPIIEKPRA